MTPTTTAAALSACAAALTMAACGGSTPSSADQDAKREQAQLKFARCMRSHGVNVPDPKPGPDGGPGNVRVGGPGGKDGPSPQVFERADAACRKYIQAVMPKLSPAQQAELRDQALKFSQCMRKHGVPMSDPQVSNGGLRISIKGGPGRKGINPDSPAFKDAQEACKAFQPKKPDRK
jgi:hypothetical protein